MKDKDMREQFTKFLESHIVFLEVTEDTLCELLARVKLLEESN